jgi:hydroxymethylglutaryl-CoA lyase
MKAADVIITEVGPRDGLQNTKSFMPTAAKQAWISAEAATGVHAIDVCSSVPAGQAHPAVRRRRGSARIRRCHPRLDTGGAGAQLQGLRARPSRRRAPRHRADPRVRGAQHEQRAQDHGTGDRGLCPHGRSGAIASERQTCATSGCLFHRFRLLAAGGVAEDDVVRVAVALRQAGADAISLADTVGYANPRQVKRLFQKVRKAIGEDFDIEAHFHNTRGLGLANALAAYEVGVHNFDSTLGGLGGCPWAPGASGNVVTEDLVFMFESMGVNTGIDIGKLIEVRQTAFAALPDAEFYGHISKAGLPKGYQPLSRAA